MALKDLVASGASNAFAPADDLASAICVYAAQLHGSITYNGKRFQDFVPEQTATFVNQSDLHLPEVTVRETFDFGARVQGIGFRQGMSQPNDALGFQQSAVYQRNQAP